jgi:hypothetical protein
VQGEVRGTRYRTGCHGGLKLRTCFQPLHTNTPGQGHSAACKPPSNGWP